MEVKTFLRNIFLLIFLNFQVNGMRIQFYRYENYTGLYNETVIQPGCNTISNKHPIYSVITDTCVILYASVRGYTNCNTEYTQMILPGKSITGYNILRNFRRCIEDFGVLNIDVVGQFPDKTVKVMKSYRNVCTCVNIERYGIDKYNFWAIQSHHNDYVAYFDKDCSESRRKSKFTSGPQDWFPKGQNFSDLIRSVGPALNSAYYHLSCKLHPNISLIERSNLQLNKTQATIMDALQKQNDTILKLEQQYNETELKLESYQRDLIDKLANYQKHINGELEKIKNQLDEDDKFRS